MPERRLQRLQHTSFRNADLTGIEFRIERQIEEALLHPRSHVLDDAFNAVLVFVIPVKGRGPRPEPLAILFNIEVESPVRAVGPAAHRAEFQTGANLRGVRPEQYGKPGRDAALVVFRGGKALVDARIDAMIGVRSRKGLSAKVERRSFHFVPGLRLGRRAHAERHRGKEDDDSFHRYKYHNISRKIQIVSGCHFLAE